jgi:hypothetical protein
VRFELTKDFRPWRFSRPLPSTARPPRPGSKLPYQHWLRQVLTARNATLDAEVIAIDASERPIFIDLLRRRGHLAFMGPGGTGAAQWSV